MTKAKLDTYLNLCTQFYDISKPNPPEDDYVFYKSYVSKAQGPILEPMCGTGRFLLPLVEEGYNVVGFDASEHMLNALHEKAKSRNLNPHVWHGFIEDLQQKNRYSLIFIPAGSFGLLTDLQVAKDALGTFYNHLSKDGILLFEVATLKGIPTQIGIWNGSVMPRTDGQYIIGNFLNFQHADNVSQTIGKYELVQDNQIIRTEIEPFKVRYYDSAHMMTMLREAGFKNIKNFKAFEQSQTPDENDEVIIFECRK